MTYKNVDSDDGCGKNWISNVKTLILHNVNYLDQISPCTFYKELCNIEFTSLTKVGYRGKCNFQTKKFESTQHLVDSMKSINSNVAFLNGIQDLHLSSQICIESENINVKQREYYFDQVCDILLQWIENGNINVSLDFAISIPNRSCTDYEYCEKFALCLCKKIDNKNNNNLNKDNINGDGKTAAKCVKLLKVFEFESPYYGGDSYHFCNQIILNNRVRVGAHMKDTSCNKFYNSTPAQIHFVIQLIKINETFRGKKKLIDCKCWNDTLLDISESD